MNHGRFPRVWRAGLSLAAVGQLCMVSACATAPKPGVTASASEWSFEALSGRHIATEHFELFTTLEDNDLEQGLPEFLEDAYDRFEKMLPSPEGTHPRLTVYLFGRRSEWEYFTRRRFPTRYDTYARIRRGGYTEGSMSVSFYTDRGATLATLAHEAWHQYVGSRFGAVLPAWLNEGLACYHEAARKSTYFMFARADRNPYRINCLCEAVQRDDLMPLTRLVGTDAGAVISRDDHQFTQTYYAQAWALVTFLRFGGDPKLAEAFDALLADVAAGKFRARVGAARLAARPGTSEGAAVFYAYFGCGPEELQAGYYDHIVRACGF